MIGRQQGPSVHASGQCATLDNQRRTRVLLLTLLGDPLLAALPLIANVSFITSRPSKSSRSQT